MKNKIDYTAIHNYIVDQIDSYDHGVYVETRKEKLIWLREVFSNEYQHEIDRVGTQIALTEWLQGLPSACSLEYSNHNILVLAKKWGSIPENATEKQEDKILNNYWNFMSYQIIKMWNKLDKKAVK